VPINTRLVVPLLLYVSTTYTLSLASPQKSKFSRQNRRGVYLRFYIDFCHISVERNFSSIKFRCSRQSDCGLLKASLQKASQKSIFYVDL
jgi:hypothetical protein